MEQQTSASKEQIGSRFKRYNAATLGLRNYWYPAMFSTDLGRKPVSRTLLGETLMFVREQGKAYALHDRCPHRGIPLSVDPRREFAGTISCGYHGWTYDLESGRLVAAITDGPDSPICGKVTQRTYPVEERAGLVWVYIGEEPAPPVEEDIPEEFLREDAVIKGVIQHRPGNWRYAVENGYDEGHAKYLHRTTPWMFFRELPSWTRIHIEADGKWLIRVADEVGWETDYPGLGRWPQNRVAGIRTFWKARGRNATEIGIRLPGQLRVRNHGWTDYEIYVPVDEDTHLAVLMAVRFTKGIDAWLWRLRYWAYIRWIFYGLLNGGQDSLMIKHTQIPPERLYRPDISITTWRRLCEEHARGVTPAPATNGASHGDEVEEGTPAPAIAVRR